MRYYELHYAAIHWKPTEVKDTDGRLSPKWVQQATCPRARLPWKEKYEIFVECQERGITKGFEQVGDICRSAARKFHLKKELSYSTIKRMLHETRTYYWSPWAVQRRPKEAIECIMRWIRNVYARMGTRYGEQASLFVWCDYSGKGQARAMLFEPVSSVQKQTFIHFSNSWLDSFKKEISSNVTRHTAKARTRTTPRQKWTSLSCGVSLQRVAQMTYITQTRWASSTPLRLQQLLGPPRCRGGRKWRTESLSCFAQTCMAQTGCRLLSWGGFTAPGASARGPAPSWALTTLLEGGHGWTAIYSSRGRLVSMDILDERTDVRHYCLLTMRHVTEGPKIGQY